MLCRVFICAASSFVCASEDQLQINDPRVLSLSATQSTTYPGNPASNCISNDWSVDCSTNYQVFERQTFHYRYVEVLSAARYGRLILLCRLVSTVRGRSVQIYHTHPTFWRPEFIIIKQDNEVKTAYGELKPEPTNTTFSYYGYGFL